MDESTILFCVYFSILFPKQDCPLKIWLKKPIIWLE